MTGDKKQQTHDRILRAAARAIRAHGYGGASVADIMKDAGLTHGGFYAHFESRDALLAEAADRAGAQGIEDLARIAANAPAGDALNTLLRAYLSREHVAQAELGCPVVALGSEMARQAPEVRAAATRRIKELIDLIGRQLPDWGQPDAHQNALFTVAAMVGALTIARAVDDPKLSDAMRHAALAGLGVPRR
jgi:AcrR family transcriptional regulator